VFSDYESLSEGQRELTTVRPVTVVPVLLFIRAELTRTGCCQLGSASPCARPPSWPGGNTENMYRHRTGNTQKIKEPEQYSNPHSRTANEGQVRIQYKCLVSVLYIFLEIKLSSLLFSKAEFCLPIPTLIYSICEIFIYFQDLSVHFPAAKYVDRSWEYINRSQIHECRNWEQGHHSVSFLGIHKLEPDIYMCILDSHLPFICSYIIIYFC